MNKSFVDPQNFRRHLALRGVNLKTNKGLGLVPDLATLRSLLVSAQRHDGRCTPPADGQGHQWRPGTGVVPVSERYRIAHP